MHRKKILIIDDEFPIRYLIEHQLRQQGFEVNLAKDGPGGIRTAHEYRPDLILLDAMMPGMDGFQVCSQIRNEPNIADTPIIFLTALETKEYKSRAFETGADDYLTKPFQVDELVAHITAVLHRYERIQTGNVDLPRGQVVSLYSPKGGVGTTTLTVQLGEAIRLHANQPVVLIDLDLPLGGIAPMLNLYTRHHIVDLLQVAPDRLSSSLIKQYTQRHRAELLVIPAPGDLFSPDINGQAENLGPILKQLTSEGFHVVLDVGSTLTSLTKTALQRSDYIFTVTSGQPVANKLQNSFLEKAEMLGLESRRLMPVVNDLYGETNMRQLDLLRMPVAHIPRTTERSRTRLWLKEQGMRKLVSII